MPSKVDTALHGHLQLFNSTTLSHILVDISLLPQFLTSLISDHRERFHKSRIQSMWLLNSRSSTSRPRKSENICRPAKEFCTWRNIGLNTEDIKWKVRRHKVHKFGMNYFIQGCTSHVYPALLHWRRIRRTKHENEESFSIVLTIFR